MSSVIESAIEAVGDTALGAVSAVEEHISSIGSTLSELVSGEEEQKRRRGRWLVLLLVAVLVLAGVAWWKRSTATDEREEVVEVPRRSA
jgi:cytoskeletal protein RodZ